MESDPAKNALRAVIPAKYVELFESIDRAALGGLCAGSHTGAREFLKDIRRLLAKHELGDTTFPFKER